MNPTSGLERLFEWLLNRSWQAGVLVLCVLLVQWLFRRQLTNRWRFALWWIVLARLLLPFGPESELSLFNCFKSVGSTAIHSPDTGNASKSLTLISPVAEKPGAPTYAQSIQFPKQSDEAKAAPAVIPAASSGFHSDTALPQQASSAKPGADLHQWIWTVAIGIWLAGAMTLAVCVFFQVFRFTKRLARSATEADDRSREILTACQCESGVTRKIQLLETEAVKSPALFGLFRLRLLLPKGILVQFDRQELRYIFLHELAHVRRGDLWLNWLVTSLQVLHWFNPLLWLGFARLRADRELACDELALLHTGETTTETYGSTIIKLLEGAQRPATMPGLVGILEDKNQMRRRISRIAGFKKATRWSAMAGLLLLALGVVALTDAEPGVSATTRPNLKGTVETKAGQPLRATVFIYTAGPRTGTSPLCPSCYADCQKTAKADANGHFEIKSLDPQLIFRILAVAPGYKPKFVSKVDPAKGPLKIRLSPIELAAAPPGNCLHGRVVDPKDKPIVGAVVEARGISTSNVGWTWGALSGVDPLAVTDDKGEFVITSRKPFYALAVLVKARGYANKSFDPLASGDKTHRLVLTEGAAITGRVLFEGKPLSNIEVGVVPVDRSAGHFTGSLEVGTDERGRFLLANLPPNVKYFVYGLMRSLQPFGSLPVQVFRSGTNGAVTDVGNLPVVPGYRLAGRVVLADGGTLPPRTRLLISREIAWDSLQVSLPADGRFDLTNLPAETYSLSVRLRGYHLSVKNASLDTMNPFELVGQVNGDITNLILLLEKGKRKPLAPSYGNILPQSEWPQNLPLRGAEFKPTHSHEWAVSGLVTDRQTGKPLTRFHVTPGEEDLTWRRFNWDSRNTVEGTNGIYTVFLNKRWAQPVLKVEAGGYLPASATVTPLEQTNADFQLQKGNGPSGIVLLPDGKPAAKTDVILICADSRQPNLNSAGHLNSWPNQSLLVRTDAKGRFAFAPRLKMRSVASASHVGFVQVPVAELATNPVVRLEPYGEIKGVLERPTGPGTNENLFLAYVGPMTSIDQRINLSNSSHTDASGRFDFKRVPPGKLQISYRLRMKDEDAWMGIPLQQVTLKPGQTLELNIKAPARQTPMHYVSGGPPPPIRVSGVKLKGSVVLPNGKPAKDVQVSLQVKNHFFQLGRASLISNQAWQDGLMVRTDSDGKFILPMCQGAEGVIAVSEDGFARVPLVKLKHSPQITLQPWGRIEGTLLINHRPGVSEVLKLSGQSSTWSQFMSYEPDAFQVRTDDRGRFAMTYVPPGEQTILHIVPQGAGGSVEQPIDRINLKPGELKHVNLSLNGRTVIGKVTTSGTNAPPDWQHGYASIHTAFIHLMEELWHAKTQQERMALIQSKAYQAAIKNNHNYRVILSADGSFKAEDVAPGKYELGVQFGGSSEMVFPPTNITFLTSIHDFVVPKIMDTNSEAPVNLGLVELKPFAMSAFIRSLTNLNRPVVH